MSKFSLSQHVKGYIEWQLEHYHDDIKQLEEYRKDLILRTSPGSGGVKGGISNPTEQIALILSTNQYIQTTERSIKAIERALQNCDTADIKLIELVYWKRSYTVTGAGMRVGLSQRGAYKRINKILCAIALEMGLVTP